MFESYHLRGRPQPEPNGDVDDRARRLRGHEGGRQERRETTWILGSPPAQPSGLPEGFPADAGTQDDGERGIQDDGEREDPG